MIRGATIRSRAQGQKGGRGHVRASLGALLSPVWSAHAELLEHYKAVGALTPLAGAASGCDTLCLMRLGSQVNSDKCSASPSTCLGSWSAEETLFIQIPLLTPQVTHKSLTPIHSFIHSVVCSFGHPWVHASTHIFSSEQNTGCVRQGQRWKHRGFRGGHWRR